MAGGFASNPVLYGVIIAVGGLLLALLALGAARYGLKRAAPMAAHEEDNYSLSSRGEDDPSLEADSADLISTASSPGPTASSPDRDDDASSSGKGVSPTQQGTGSGTPSDGQSSNAEPIQFFDV